MAGGVALNCVANGKVLKSRNFESIWIQPASGDAGGALGCALATHHLYLSNSRNKNLKNKDDMRGSYLGPNYNQVEIENSLKNINAKFKTYKEAESIKIIANYLKSGKIVGWFQGAMEFGPRALGGRSILADPRSRNMQKN